MHCLVATRLLAFLPKLITDLQQCMQPAQGSKPKTVTVQLLLQLGK
jgi:hypothetical protein